MISPKLKYFLGSTKKWLLHDGFSCPACGHSASTVVSRKYLVTALRRCANCALQFRTPTTTEKESYSFYQSDYAQGFTTEMPSPEELNLLLQTEFKGTERDYSRALQILSALGCQPGQRLLDYGCSWGYGSWQLARAGYQVTGLEISRPRCEYARQHLQINAYSDPNEIKGPFDIFFSSHVLEHVPSPLQVLDFAASIVKPGGWVVTLAPNGSQHFRTRKTADWNHLWGMVHPNFLDDLFFQKVFAESLLLCSDEYTLEDIQRWAEFPEAIRIMSLQGPELLAVSRNLANPNSLSAVSRC